jgi:hypothetical protein
MVDDREYIGHPDHGQQVAYVFGPTLASIPCAPHAGIEEVVLAGLGAAPRLYRYACAPHRPPGLWGQSTCVVRNQTE